MLGRSRGAFNTARKASSSNQGSMFGVGLSAEVAKSSELKQHTFFKRQLLVTEGKVEVQPVEERIRHGPTFSFRRSAAALTFAPAASDPPDSAASERAESPSRHRVKVVKKMEMSTWGPRWAIESVSHSELPAPAPPPEQEPEPGPGPTSPVVVQSESETRSSATQRDSSSDTRRSSKELEDPRSRDPPMSDLDRQRRWLDSMLEDSVSYDAMAPTPNDRHGGTKDLGSTGYRYRAASVMQARVRGRRTRVRHGDAVETAVVAASARLQVDRCLKRNAQGSPIRGENQGAGSEYLRWVAGPSNTAVGLTHMESWRAGTTTRLVATATAGSLPVGSKDPSPYPSSVEDNWSGLSDSMRNRLARAQHWRLCPSCNAVVTERSDDGSSRCTKCSTGFRWVRAPLYMPCASLAQLRQEIRWEHEERLRELTVDTIGWKDVARLYWVQSDHASRTEIVSTELTLYRALLFGPLLLALPALTLMEKRRHAHVMRDCQLLDKLVKESRAPALPLDPLEPVDLPGDGCFPWSKPKKPRPQRASSSAEDGTPATAETVAAEKAAAEKAAAEKAAAVPSLPAGWKQAQGPDGRTYYWYKAADGTKKTQWKRPSAEPGAEPPAVPVADPPAPESPSDRKSQRPDPNMESPSDRKSPRPDPTSALVPVAVGGKVFVAQVKIKETASED
jgi:hypothetical protein